VSANDTITQLLSTPLGPAWTVEALAEQVLTTIAAQRSEESQEFILDAYATTDRQTRRLLRPLLACLATKSAAEAGAPANLYGGHFSFERQGPAGPVWIVGQFENRPGRVRVTLRRSNSPPPGDGCGTVPSEPPVQAPEAVPIEEDATSDKGVQLPDRHLERELLRQRIKR
jgi:hypothetical protein